MPNSSTPANNNAWPDGLADIVAILKAAEQIAAEHEPDVNDCAARLGAIGFLVERCRVELAAMTPPPAS